MIPKTSRAIVRVRRCRNDANGVAQDSLGLTRSGYPRCPVTLRSTLKGCGEPARMQESPGKVGNLPNCPEETNKALGGIAAVRLIDGTIHTAEIHWYEAHGIGRKEFKLKLPLPD